MTLCRGTTLVIAALLAFRAVPAADAQDKPAIPAATAAASGYKAPERRRIYLMRHGDVTYFDNQGKPVPDPNQVVLNDKGKAQADAAGRWLASLGIKRLDLVVTSNLPRTVETAERVLRAGRIAGEIRQVRDLREIRSASLARTTPAAELPAAWLAFAQETVATDTKFLGGETLGELQQRVFPALDGLLADQGWDTSLVVLHGVVNNAIVSRALTGGTDYFGHLEASAGCVHILDAGPTWSDWIVQAFNVCPEPVSYAGERLSVLERLLLQALKGRQ